MAAFEFGPEYEALCRRSEGGEGIVRRSRHTRAALGHLDLRGSWMLSRSLDVGTAAVDYKDM